MHLFCKKIIVLLSLIIGLCNGQLLFAGNAEIELRSSVNMESSVVLLGDIASIKTMNGAVRDDLLKINVMKSPRIGYVSRISEKEVRKALRLNRGFDNLDLVFTGSEKVIVHTKGREVKFDEIYGVAKNTLLKVLNNDKRDVEVSIIKPRDKLTLPFGKLRFEARMNASDVNTKMCVWVDVYTDEKFYKSIPVWAKVAVYEEVYLAKEYITKNSVISEDDFKVAILNTAKLAGKQFSIESFRGELLLNKSLEKGDALRVDIVKNVPSVIAGKVVDVTVNVGAVSIVVKAIAKRNAVVGETVKVKSLQGGSILNTQVIGKQLVKVI